MPNLLYRSTGRKLSKATGEYILWHVLEHLQAAQGSSEYYLDGYSDAADTVRNLLSLFSN